MPICPFTVWAVVLEAALGWLLCAREAVVGTAFADELPLLNVGLACSDAPETECAFAWCLCDVADVLASVRALVLLALVGRVCDCCFFLGVPDVPVTSEGGNAPHTNDLDRLVPTLWGMFADDVRGASAFRSGRKPPFRGFDAEEVLVVDEPDDADDCFRPSGTAGTTGSSLMRCSKDVRRPPKGEGLVPGDVTAAPMEAPSFSRPGAHVGPSVVLPAVCGWTCASDHGNAADPLAAPNSSSVRARRSSNRRFSTKSSARLTSNARVHARC